MTIMSKKLIFSIVAFLLFLVLLEMSAQVFESSLTVQSENINKERGWQVEFFSAYFDWHRSDPDLLWHFKPNMANKLIFTNNKGILGGEIAKEKRAETVRILILGDSSPVGLGLERREQAFDSKLKYLLREKYIGKRNLEIINGAVPGYTSEQILKFLEIKGWPLEPDIVILYCGNNDASVSGYYTDREILNQQILKTPRRFMSSFAFYRVIKNAITSQKNRNEPTTGNRPLSLRVPPEQFEENLIEIADEGQKRNCRLIILQPPVPYIWPAGLQFKVFSHLTGKDGELIVPEPMINVVERELLYCLEYNEFMRIFGTGDIFIEHVINSAYSDSISNDSAIQYYSAKIEQDKNNHLFYNNLGVSLWKDGQYDKADINLKTARALYQQSHKKNKRLTISAAGVPYLYNIGINLISMSGKGVEILNDSTSEAVSYLDSALQSDYFS
ncbi:MAG: hypothetical protein GY865_18115, partial [candidate division Zixibacteria bacterium]|nr:hypothetical protein [candidate division Zixibacteria bacterium]